MMNRSWKKISPDDGFHYFFGYYDRNPWNGAIDRHLCLRTVQCERLPVRGETAEIGLLDGSGNFEPLVTTRAWCPQQGSMQLFLPGTDRLVYNDFDGEKIVARIYEIGKGVIGSYSRGIYAISPDGRYAVSLDFARIPRRGYSYADAVLSAELQPDWDNDGLFLLDLASGKSRLIVSYRAMLEHHPWRYSTEGRFVWLNHAIFNCDSSRLLWLFRQCAPEHPNDGCWWQTFMYTCDLTGNDAECILPERYWSKGGISHQIWGRTPREILVDANWDGDGNAAVVFDEAERPFHARRLAASHGSLSHMVFSPDGRFLLADSYPIQGEQRLLLIDAATGAAETLGTFAHRLPEHCSIDLRCDLHPRWSRDGRRITVDSIDSGKRAVYLLELPPRL